MRRRTTGERPKSAAENAPSILERPLSLSRRVGRAVFVAARHQGAERGGGCGNRGAAQGRAEENSRLGTEYSVFRTDYLLEVKARGRFAC
jgi:hypothetical protein